MNTLLNDHERPGRIALFNAPDFPTVDAPEIPGDVLDKALEGLSVEHMTSPGQLGHELNVRLHGVLILPHGSAFPLDAWIPIRSFVKNGGSLLVLGGAPFHQPVIRTADGFRLGVRQPSFAHDFLIAPAEVWKRDDTAGQQTLPEGTGWGNELPQAKTIWKLTVRLATQPDLPEEHGSEGHRDAILRPLVHEYGDVGGFQLPVACPLVEIDRLRGDDAGARWLFYTGDAALDSETLRALVDRVLEGAVELDARPVHANLQEGETARIRIAQRRPRPSSHEKTPGEAGVIVRDDDGKEIFRTTTELVGQAGARHGEAEIKTSLAPGLYHVEVETPGAPWSPRKATTGFWVQDNALISSATPLTVSRDWLRQGESVLPAIGTTYMSSDIQRKFLYEPNPHLWDQDFARMAALGINFVRTGSWTAWSRTMLNSGAIDEAFLRSLEAYVQSAAKHGIVVNYTFFAFLPPAYGVGNPYLSPRALEGQRELLTLVARRFRGNHWIHWDLINEPSYAGPNDLWTNKPVGDEHEAKAFERWIEQHHGDDDAVLRERWQDSSEWIRGLPNDDSLAYNFIREKRLPRKTRDFTIFCNDVVADWARELRTILRDIGGDVLVTLGQDERGTDTSPSQQLHANAVDYTAMHPWWNNDDLLASGVMGKLPEKPGQFQETGLMRLEDMDGWPWRSPELAAQVLEKKFALAFAARHTGVIEWAWNINPYQPIDNEAVIGFWRPDGTAKPELRVIAEFARFFKKAAPLLTDFEPDEVVAVIPHSRLFMRRPGGVEGFKRLVRLLAEYWGVVPTALSELRLTAERLAHAKLIIVPSPLVLEDSASAALLAASENGSKVLITGAVLGNPYGAIPDALSALGVVDPGRPVELREKTGWSAAAQSETGWATFDRDLREQLERSNSADLVELSGSIWHEPLPLEFAREEEPLVALLGAALEAASVSIHPSDTRVTARTLTTDKVTLAVLVNETTVDAQRELNINGKSVRIPVAAGRSRLVLFERDSAAVLATTAGQTII